MRRHALCCFVIRGTALVAVVCAEWLMVEFCMSFLIAVCSLQTFTSVSFLSHGVNDCRSLIVAWN